MWLVWDFAQWQVSKNSNHSFPGRKIYVLLWMTGQVFFRALDVCSNTVHGHCNYRNYNLLKVIIIYFYSNYYLIATIKWVVEKLNLVITLISKRKFLHCQN